MRTELQPERRQTKGIRFAPRPFEIKSVDVKGRTFEGIAAAYSLDLGGDVIHPGAFAKWLDKWKATGFAVPLINQHNYYDGIHDVLGSMIDGEERKEGLWSMFEVDEGEDGQKLIRHIEKKRINGLSMGYQVVESETDPNGIRHLTEINLREVSAVIWPMNPDAVFDPTSVKSAASEMSDDDIKEMRAALDSEALARYEKANPRISEEKAAELRARFLKLRLRPLLSSAKQPYAHTTTI